MLLEQPADQTPKQLQEKEGLEAAVNDDEAMMRCARTAYACGQCCIECVQHLHAGTYVCVHALMRRPCYLKVMHAIICGGAKWGGRRWGGGAWSVRACIGCVCASVACWGEAYR